ncbi:MAG TPA: CoA-binding protein [Dehalococcoidia bacterium]
MAEHPLEYIFHPRHVAIAGASPSTGGMGGGSFLNSIVEMGFKGPIYPINPRYDEIAGLKCYQSLRDAPTDVDYVISSVPAAVVPQLIEDCAAKNVKVVHFFTAGFSETGDEARTELEHTIMNRTKELGIRVIGPNCMGLYVPDVGLAFMGGFPKEKGRVALLSQSGANAGEFVNSGALRGLRYSKAVSYGNAADLCDADFFDYVADDPETDIVASYMEGVRGGRHFVQALKKAAARKPVVILKGGRTTAGGRATRSHTASLAGPIQVFDALCRQAGAVRVESMEELVDMVIAFKHVKKLTGPNAVVIVGGGGRSVLSADDINAEGLDVPHLPEETQEQMRSYVPAAGTSVRNPIDAMLGTDSAAQVKTLHIVAAAPNIDFLIYSGGFGPGPGRPSTPDQQRPDANEQAKKQVDMLVEVQRESGKPAIFVSGVPSTGQAFEGYQALLDAASDAGIAVFPTMRRAALALSRLLKWQRQREE